MGHYRCAPAVCVLRSTRITHQIVPCIDCVLERSCISTALVCRPDRYSAMLGVGVDDLLVRTWDSGVISAEAVVGWARLAERWSTYELGADSALAEEARRVVLSPGSHEMWGGRERMRVGGPEGRA